jgi:hypothetical protein
LAASGTAIEKIGEKERQYAKLRAFSVPARGIEDETIRGTISAPKIVAGGNVGVSGYVQEATAVSRKQADLAPECVVQARAEQR